MAHPSNKKSTKVTCAVLLLLLAVSLQPSAARLLRPVGGGDADVPSEVKGHLVVDKYTPLLLTMLPRGPAPPSAPSGGTNEAWN
ncbi:hypothetical protein BRADI_2g30818v3 [Brachypodium distachyon]|uniref:Uncharacterized protein n=1 Tax=Brachypodium distachyon TaxID=15368 RepID=A0A0Q3MRF6_BRADI|nr:hypothetical protein BRADI_2g30818v3 [Brachypodium distachyon]